MTDEQIQASDREVAEEIKRLQAQVTKLKGHLDWLGWGSDGVDKARAEIKRLRAVDKQVRTYVDIRCNHPQAAGESWRDLVAVLDANSPAEATA